MLRWPWLAMAVLLAAVMALSPARAVRGAGPAPVLLVVPALDVWAPVAAFPLNDDLTMPAPQEAGAVAWYTYSAGAGGQGNAVLAGHRDWQRQRGVFYELGRLRDGDAIWLRDAEGAWYRYRVLWTASIEDAAAPVDDIVGPALGAVLTLITCSGAFDATTGRYVERRVVRAVFEQVVLPALEEER